MIKVTDAEKTALEQFRSQIQDVLPNAEDDYLLRWLRARNLDLGKAKEMLKANLEWRLNNPQLENLCNWYPGTEVFTDITYKFTGLDYQGHPVLFMPIGSWNIRKLIEEGHKDETFRYFYKIMEEILSRIQQAREASRVTQIVTVFDVAGLTLWKIASFETVQLANRFFREFESYYPEILHKIYVINSHWVFSYGFKVVKPLISTNTFSKIQVLTDKSNWKPVLDSLMPSECIPPEYEGTGESIVKKQPVRKLTKNYSCPPSYDFNLN